VRGDIQLLAEGLHPAALARGGLDGALAALGAGSTITVDVVARAGRIPPAVEGAAWFVCSEALANVAKHSAASRAFVRAAREDDVVRVEISDDGRGGADPARGSGLRGMAERVEALGGRLWVADRPGGGTVVAAELPTR
jgi:signal transduction histidine kinase